MEGLLTALVIGLANGLIIALIAIGYTLVYGILELINFAHGDVFMLGTAFTFFATTFIVDSMGFAPDSTAALGLTFVALPFIMLFCAIINGKRRKRRRMRRSSLVLLGGALILAGTFGCGALRDAFSPRAEVTARANNQALTVERVAGWAGAAHCSTTEIMLSLCEPSTRGAKLA